MQRPNITPPPYTIQLSDHHANDSKIIADGEVIAICCSRGHLGEQHATTKAFAAVPELLELAEKALKADFSNIMEMKFLAQAALTKAGYTF